MLLVCIAESPSPPSSGQSEIEERETDMYAIQVAMNKIPSTFLRFFSFRGFLWHI